MFKRLKDWREANRLDDIFQEAWRDNQRKNVAKSFREIRRISPTLAREIYRWANTTDHPIHMLSFSLFMNPTVADRFARELEFIKLRKDYPCEG